LSAILALDQGTTSSRAIIFDHHGRNIALAQQELHQSFPQPGWVEHDPAEIWQTQLSVARHALSQANLGPADIDAIGITNQRETTVVWDRATGMPIHNAIVWQDRRTAAFCDQLKADGHARMIQEKTGLVIDAYFSATKLRWILDNVHTARQRAGQGQLAFGTIDTWLLWNLTAGKSHITDASNASRTMLYNIHANQWDDQLLELFDIPRSLLPDVRDSSELYAQTPANLFGQPIPIAGIAGDQQAALFGQACFQPGLAKNTYGTGCFMLMNIGAEPILSEHQLLTTVAWKLGDKTVYALEGSVFIGGAVVQWLRDGLGLIKHARDIETLARSVKDNGGVYLVPAFAGLGAPHWDPYARGTVTGITRGTTAGHFARAALEGIAYQVADLFDVMQQDAHAPITELRVDGAAASNNLLMQFQADLLRLPIVRPEVTETTALGAACLAGLAVGFWKNTDELNANWRAEHRFSPTMDKVDIDHKRTRWRQALSRARHWEQPDDGR